MSDYLYFLNNLEGTEAHVKAEMISCKIFFHKR